uniref:WGS project CBMI000000000 data, contig CS3069_c004917 n=1 Tax=Fusarium clavum TaxID=2594811 RepID=A0A090MF05_9HYPO|nr:unnamed protein product [Fusarium clavum]
MPLFNQGPCDKAFNTPYRGNLECLKSVRKAKAKDMSNIATIPINTTDSFPGREGYVVILVLGVNESNSLRFIANKNRICVGTTRHIGALSAIGDVKTAPEVMRVVDKKKTSLRKSDDLESESVKSDVFWMMLNWFRQAWEDLSRKDDLERRVSARKGT